MYPLRLINLESPRGWAPACGLPRLDSLLKHRSGACHA
jgi:hypothetical protein